MDKGTRSVYSAVLKVLPACLRDAIEAQDHSEIPEEIRLRVGRKPQVVYPRGDVLLDLPSFTADDSRELLERLCGHSVYAHEEELIRGFLTSCGGVRIGICGRPVCERGRIIRFTDVSAFNIRIPFEAVGCAEDIMSHFTEHGRPVSSLIAAPPGGGKTTLLRDIARCISNGVGCAPMKVALADERGEIAGCVNGVPSFEIGARTDVMEFLPKSEAMMMLVRTMSPEVIITDEIGGEEDCEAVEEAGRCGVAVIAAAHASSVEDLTSRASLKRLMDRGVFKRVLLLRRHRSTLRIYPVRL